MLKKNVFLQFLDLTYHFVINHFVITSKKIIYLRMIKEGACNFLTPPEYITDWYSGKSLDL